MLFWIVMIGILKSDTLGLSFNIVSLDIGDHPKGDPKDE